ncbi:MAG: DUF1924 domain-containing protein [Gammaproteobacteria bacterium]|nr:DUF1924 domain-containing protein [Gammaproteobacteria bacterium]MDH5592062.1 DUF1924 domain-containing protein [Gammaproteobacteria bacterium]
MPKYILLLTGMFITLQSPVFATEVVDTTLQGYQSQGAGEFSVDAGKTLWNNEIIHSKSPVTRSCASCHGNDFNTTGKHIKTGKTIKPMSPTANPKRFTDQEKIEKWFRRNCKWTWGRECTAQEKGDMLLFLSKQ